MVGKILQGRYEIVKPIGFGGMADVYLAKDILLDRNVAVKVLRSQFLETPTQLNQFHREAQSAARLIHPSIINIYDVCEEDNLHYIVMEYVEGVTLKNFEETHGKLDVNLAISIAVQIASALKHAHKRHIIHCDIKPQNIILDENMVPKIVDFGISKIVSNETIAFTSSVIGSVHYLSPEQAQGDPVTAQSDVYSLGIVLYEMLTGEVPFRGSTAISVAKMQIENTPPPLSNYLEDVPVSLQEIMDKALAKNLDERYQTAGEICQDLMAVKNQLIGSMPVTEITMPLPSVPVRDYNHKGEADSMEETMVMVPPSKAIIEEKREQAKVKKQLLIAKVKKYLMPVVAVLLLLMLGGGYFLFSSKPAVNVPNVAGLTVVEAQKRLEKAGFKVKLEEVPDASITPGIVIKQDPDNKEKRKEGSTVTLYVSKGLELIEVPSVTGLSLNDAKTMLKASGFEVGRVSKVWKKDKAQGEVLEQLPKVKSKAPKGSKIDLVVNDKDEKKKDTMPALLESTLLEAKEKLSGMGYSISEVKNVDSDKPEGTILGMSPEAGTELSSDTKIVLQVSTGKKVETKPVSATESGAGDGVDSKGVHYVEFVVPGNDGDHNVQVFVVDSEKQWNAVEGVYKSGTRIRQKIDSAGHTTVQFYVDKKLIKEKSW